MMKNEREIKYLKNDELKQLFLALESDRTRHAVRNKAIFHLAYYCALRVSEITNMGFSAYDPLNQQIYCRREKGSNNNTLRIIDKQVLYALNNYLKLRESLYPESCYLFPSQMGSPISRQQLDTLMKKYCKYTAIPSDKHHFHVLKHTRAVTLGDAGLDIKDIQWWLGHKNIENTMIYLQYTTHQQEILYQKLAVQERRPYEYPNQCYF